MTNKITLYWVLIVIEMLNVVFFFVSSQVRTLFVSGLPMDAKPRELYLLFRAYEVSNRFFFFYFPVNFLFGNNYWYLYFRPGYCTVEHIG